MAEGQAEVVSSAAQPLVVAGLTGHIGEQVPQAVTDKAEPVAVRAGAEQAPSSRSNPIQVAGSFWPSWPGR